MSDERQQAILDEIGRLVSELIALRNPDDDTILIGWAGAYEWTSVELEQAHTFGTATIAPREQAGSLTRGLLELGADHMSPQGARE